GPKSSRLCACSTQPASKASRLSCGRSTPLIASKSNCSSVLPVGSRASLKWRARRRRSRSASSYSHSAASVCATLQPWALALNVISSQQAAIVGSLSWRSSIGRAAALAMTDLREQRIVRAERVLSTTQARQRCRPARGKARLQLDEGRALTLLEGGEPMRAQRLGTVLLGGQRKGGNHPLADLGRIEPLAQALVNRSPRRPRQELVAKG